MKNETRALLDQYTMKVEGYLSLYCKPRPAWMPERLYRWLMSRVVLYEELPKFSLARPSSGEQR